MTAAVTAKDPLARAPLVESPNWQPSYVIKKYVTYLAEWSRRKLIEAAAEPVLFALGVARKAVEELGEGHRDVDGLNAIDRMLGRMVGRIDQTLVRVHEAAVEIDRSRRVAPNAMPPLRAGAEPQQKQRDAKGLETRGLE